MTASVLTVTSTTATMTIASRVFIVASRPRPLTGRIFVVHK
jgi:hypothetical protein